MTAWWTMCQPLWQTALNGWPQPLTNFQVKGDWKPILIGGNNGIICIVMSLYWWGKHLVKTTGVDVNDWLAAVKDVSTILSACVIALAS
jgi:hypothetical protein